MKKNARNRRACEILCEVGGLVHKYLLVLLVACIAWPLAGCASSDASKSPESGETAVSGEKSTVPPVEEKPAAAAKEGAERPEATAEVEEASRKDPVENVYSGAMSTEVREDLKGLPERVYVPNIIDGTVSVVDPGTFEVVRTFAVGELPYHVTPSWDMTELYVNNEASGTFTVIDAVTGRPKETIEAPFPYNFYYAPDGEKAVVVAERVQMLEFRDPETWKLLGSVYIPWPGVDHMDFSADGSYLLASSEWSGVVSKVDVEKMELVDHAEVGGLPIDIKLSPDGSVFYVANQGRMGVSLIDPKTMEEVRFVPTGEGAHGLQVSRDAKKLYVSNRLEGTISVIDFATREVVDTWTTGGSPDMFQLSPDGRQLWVSGRYNGAVYVVDTETGELLSTIYTGTQPHGIAYFPNPGRYSLGHNGVYR